MARRKSRPVEPIIPVPRQPPPDTGPESAGQSGDLQGLAGGAEAGDESVRELLEEGQIFAGTMIDGVENAPLPEKGPLRPRRRSEDDLPPEYTDVPADEPKE